MTAGSLPLPGRESLSRAQSRGAGVRGGRRDLLALLALVALTAPALGPLLGPGLVQSNDVASHLYRVVCLDESLRAGVLYPRWFPQMAYGYGYALPNYFSPLSYYLAEAFHLLSLGFVESLKLAFACGFLAAGLGMYALAREVFGKEGRWAALVAAVAYVYLPYAWVDAYGRGALAEHLAVALLPAVLWAVGRLARTGRRVYVPVVAILLAALILTHNVTAFLFLPLMTIYAAWQMADGRWQMADGKPQTANRYSLSAICYLLLALLLALALSACYWLPALAEKSLVFLDQRTTGYYDVRNQLLPLGNLVQLSPAYDYRTTTPQVGLVQAVLFALALPSLVWGMRGRRAGLLFFALLALGSVLFVTAPTEAFWVHVPLVQFVWFPWRLLACAGLGTALLAGTLAHPAGWPARLAARLILRLRRRSLFQVGDPKQLALALSVALMTDQVESFQLPASGDPAGVLRLAQRARPVAAAVAGLAVLVAVLLSTPPDLRPAYWAFPDATTIPALHRVEYNTQTLGLTVASEYLPATVQENPTQMPRDDLLSRGVPAGPVPDVTFLRAAPFAVDLATAGDSPGGPVVLHQFYFPGWAAWVDDQPVPVTPVGSLGLVRIDVPAGAHRVSCRFTDTPVRTLANLVALVGLAALVGILCWSRSWRALAVIIILASVLGLLLALPGAGFPLPMRGEGQGEGGITPHRADFGPGLRLLGYHLDTNRLNTARELGVTLYWQARQPLTTSHIIDVGLATEPQAEHGVVAVHRGVPVYGCSPTTKWEVGEIVADTRTLRLTSDAPPGRYWLAAAVRQTPEGPYLETAPGQVIAWLKAVDVTRIPPARVPTPQHAAYVPLQGILELVGFDTEPAFTDDALVARPGQTITVAPHLRAADAWVPYDYTIRLTLRDTTGAVAAQADYEPVYDVPATSLWSLDWRDARALPFLLPAGLPPGDYTLECELYHGFDEQRLWPLRANRAAFDLFTVRIADGR